MSEKKRPHEIDQNNQTPPKKKKSTEQSQISDNEEDDELPELEVSISSKTGEKPDYTSLDLCTGQFSRHVQGLSFQQEKSFTQTFSASDRVNVFNLHMGPNDPIWNAISSSTTNLHDDFLDPRFPEKFPFEKIKK